MPCLTLDQRSEVGGRGTWARAPYQEAQTPTMVRHLPPTPHHQPSLINIKAPLPTSLAHGHGVEEIPCQGSEVWRGKEARLGLVPTQGLYSNHDQVGDPPPNPPTYQKLEWYELIYGEIRGPSARWNLPPRHLSAAGGRGEGVEEK